MFASPTETPVRLPRRRRRPPLSCESCRQRKVKCNRQEPCTQCITSKTTCVYTSNPFRSILPAGPAGLNSLPALTTSEDTPQQDFQASFTLSSSVVQPEQPRSLSEPQKSNVSEVLALGLDTITSDEAEIRRLQHGGQAPEQPLVIHSPNLNERRGDRDSLDKREPGIGTPWSIHGRIALNKSRLYGQSHWTHGGHEVRCTITMYILLLI
jgi:hypothetical protein